MCRSIAFFCQNPDCKRKIFTERLPELVEPFARRTNRLRDALLTIAWALGGEAGAKQCAAHAMPICASNLLSLLRRQGVSTAPTPRVLGVDDWSFRRLQAGTLLVDLEHHRPVDVLLGSDEEVFASWLREHPDVEVISRDRGASYQKGAMKGAPQAKQVLDRWHLGKNLREVLQKALARQMDALQQAGEEVKESKQDQPTAPAQLAQAGAKQRKSPRRKAPSPSPQRAWQLALYQRVHELAAEGKPQREIAASLQVQRQTVRKYLRMPQFVDRRHSPSPSQVEPYRAYLQQRWEQGEVMIKALWQEIQQQGFTGSYGSLRNFLHTWPLPQEMVASPSSPFVAPIAQRASTTRTPRQATRLLLCEPEELRETDIAYRQALFRLAPSLENLSTLGKEFLQMIKKRDDQMFFPWLKRAKASPCEEIRRFALGLENEADAALAALTEPWSTGPVEGHITRLKLLKRQMYGRANIDLLRLRVLHVA
ncbi:ISL3 family transposase [Ktedonobacter racemifer]|uniref:ISL3 family transposase n=1 Tax=Ktedonobacter racemifer TaxID=363277 RepID=UPI001FCC915E|nr:ISL3 family transposase [Ktedonobacter racemifer]